MFSLPIPESRSYPRAEIRYCDLKCPVENFRSFGDVVEQMTEGRISSNARAHLDPHLDSRVYRNPNQWRALFGQDHAAQGHLRNKGVAKGDLFLFFGIYQEAKAENGRIALLKEAPKRHVIFGWMSIGEVIPIAKLNDRKNLLEKHPWCGYHSHLNGGDVTNNTLYMAAEKTLDGLPGFGIFPRYSAKQCLTKSGETCSVWLLPPWFDPKRCNNPLSYNRNPLKWKQTELGFRLETKAPGQEYVFDTADYPKAIRWAQDLIATCS